MVGCFPSCFFKLSIVVKSFSTMVMTLIDGLLFPPLPIRYVYRLAELLVPRRPSVDLDLLVLRVELWRLEAHLLRRMDDRLVQAFAEPAREVPPALDLSCKLIYKSNKL